jgi:hypothetical protein
MPIPADRRRSQLARQVGTLVLAHLKDPGGGAARAAAWQNALARLGLNLPLFVTHDLGLLFTLGRAAEIAPRRDLLARLSPPPAAVRALEGYRALLERIAASEVIERASAWRLRDELVALLLARVLGEIWQAFPARDRSGGDLPLGPELYVEPDLLQHFADFDRQSLWAFVAHLADHAWHAYAALEEIDLDTLRLLGLFRGGGGATADDGGPLDLVELSAALRSPEANDVVNFSLELLPSVLETKRQSGAKTFAIDGYASSERQGSLDSLVLTEFAWDRDLFDRKVVDNELYYYGREKQREDERRLRYVLIDASASMRGQRATFARGLALALVKKLALAGDELWLRFFDSRLHDLVRAGRGGSVPVPYLLSFKSERGRNYGKVFRQLTLELGRLHREGRRRIAVYVITHGQCHIPVELAAQMKQLAELHGIIILPSQTLALDYLAYFDHHQVVTAETLASREGRRDRALGIVQGAGSQDSAARPAKPRTNG